MKKGLIYLCLFLSIIFVVPVKADNLNLAKEARSAILLEASTGKIIFEKNSHEHLSPASMTKMMSMLLIVESIDKGIIKWDDIVTASENAASMGGSQILLEAGEEMSVSDLFKGIAVASGNDAVVAMAEKIAGTEEEFVNMMNQRSKELGLTDTNFKNPHGLEESDHYSSAYDMALIAKELVKHEEIFKYTSIYEDYLRQDSERKLWLVNTNKLVRFYKGVDGLKTGYTDQAGYCLTATADKGFRVIAVVMGEETSQLRNKEVSEMLDYVYAQYGLNLILDKNEILGKQEVEKGKQKYVQLRSSEDITMLNKKSEGKKNYTYDINCDKIVAPVKVGDKVGVISLKEDGVLVKEIDLTVTEDIDSANIFELYLRYLKELFVL